MNAAIVTIGDEILIGQVTDTNSVFIAQQMTEMGVNVREMITVSDTPEHIRKTLDKLVGNTDLVLMTGGLGPTKDDLTKETLNEYFGGKMEVNAEALASIQAFFKKRGREMIGSNSDQALVPDVCRVMTNNFGTAPGMWFEKNGSIVISMPGVPHEMRPMVMEEVMPALKALSKVSELRTKTVMTYGVPESYLAEMISEWESSLPACMKLAYLPRPGIVRLRLNVVGKSAEEADRMIEERIVDLDKLIAEHIFAYDDILLEAVVGRMFRERKLTIATAESCTGGNISRLLTSVSGSSEYFKGAVIAYSNEVKEGILDVTSESIAEFGAVSQSVVEQMAQQVCKKLNCDIGIAVSGIAGPDGGTEEKPVGTVWIAVAGKGEKYSEKMIFGGSRAVIVEQASIKSLILVRKLLLGHLVLQD